MKKGKRALSLVMSLITMCGALVACDEDYVYPDADWHEGIIANIAGKDYTYTDIYKAFVDSKDSARAYYTTAKNVVAQAVTTKTDAIDTVVEARMTSLHDTWKSNARSNGTTYKEEKEKTLDSENVDDEDELRAKYVAEELVDENSSDFYSESSANDNGEKFYISEDQTKDYVKKAAPYHVSHILVKVDASSSGDGLWDGKISASNAQKIGDVVKMLTSSDSFGSVAQIESDDGSNVQYGELYTSKESVAMEKSTSYINEFKLGVYAYDAFLNPSTKSNENLKASLRVPGDEHESDDKSFKYNNDTAVKTDITKTKVYNGEAFGIPVSQAFKLRYLSELTTNPETGTRIDFTDETQYPRNIIFNNYFNYHGVNFVYDDSNEYDASFIKEANESLSVTDDPTTVTTVSDAITALKAAGLNNKVDEYNYVKNLLNNMDSTKFVTSGTIGDNLVNYSYDSTNNTTSYTSVGTNKKILADEKGNPIIVVRGGTSGDSGYQGIHFIIVNNDPFEDAEKKYEYWRLNIPKQGSENTSADSTDYNTNPSFINFVKADANSNTTYNNRKDAIISAIKASDSNIDFKLYEHNVEKFNSMYSTSFSTILGADVQTKIEKYISITRESANQTLEETLDSAWETYVQTLNLQQDVTPRGLVPTVCVSYFEGGNLNGKESLCHVEK